MAKFYYNKERKAFIVTLDNGTKVEVEGDRDRDWIKEQASDYDTGVPGVCALELFASDARVEYVWFFEA